MTLSSGFVHADDDSNTHLRFGIFPYISANKIVRLYKPITAYLSSHLGREVIIVTAPSFESFVERTAQQRYDLIFTAPHFAVKEEEHNTYRRLARFKDNLKGNVFVAAGSSIQDSSSLKGKVIGLPNSLAVISALGESYFNGFGMVSGIDVFYKNAPSHMNVILNVVNKQVDAGVVAEPIYNMFAKQRGDEIRLLGQTDEIAGAMFMVSLKLPEALQQKIYELFMTFPESEEGKAFFRATPFSGMVEISEEDVKGLKPYTTMLKN